MNYDLAKESVRANAAKKRLESRFTIGEEAQRRLVTQVENLHIRDRLIWPQSLYFDVRQGVPRRRFPWGQIGVHQTIDLR